MVTLIMMVLIRMNRMRVFWERRLLSQLFLDSSMETYHKDFPR